MALDPKVAADAVRFINDKWKDKLCALCKENNWLVNGYVVSTVSDTSTVVQIGGQVMPSLAVVCRTCGNTIFINALIAGLASK